MWLSDRRAFLLGAVALGGCGFTPVYGPNGGGRALQGSIALSDAATPDAYLFNRRFEDRMGRGVSPAYRLNVTLTTAQVGQGSTSTGSTTRYRIDGTAAFDLVDLATGQSAIKGTTTAFTGYSTTGSTVATLAAERDAQERLMVMLADQVIDRLFLRASTL
ncbi:LPS assembly lipoprotein LptE [Tropicibacter naphthalenivorans]|uniref:Uncharacterized protein n=1 Tax=Tropicibacter naphthalenivorans TaxID=441103 RepID=A0A0P1G9S8_9RHOB|nr:LPS assembly lipoprotein LptE [Tropicibacter naphthalenivorans]CUH78285.1 hypothetical protein TRN7648_01897 [Tropicibacter naphthalenivorans]SMC79001.1 LPS-assembly lipoprotein [Tropicibacter naphthalenivorans]